MLVWCTGVVGAGYGVLGADYRGMNAGIMAGVYNVGYIGVGGVYGGDVVTVATIGIISIGVAGVTGGLGGIIAACVGCVDVGVDWYVGGSTGRVVCWC